MSLAVPVGTLVVACETALVLDESFAVFTVADALLPTRVTRPAYEVTAFT